MKKIILFELNEVPFRVLEDYINLNPTSSIAEIYKNSKIFKTFANDIGHLSPWLTWPTIHRGVNNYKHNIGYFGQDLKEIDDEFPPIWKILTQKKISVGVCGSLQSYPLPNTLDSYDFYIPDTFANGPECFPKNIEIFQNFNLSMVDISGRNVNKYFPANETFKFLINYRKLGIKTKTLYDSFNQILSEKINKNRVVRRRSEQANLTFDIFFHNLNKYKPHFSTFFTNHVASAQHRYWLAKFPNDYSEIHYSKSWLSEFRYEIDYAMRKVDFFLKKILNFIKINKDFQLLISSSMGQEATNNTTPVNSQLYLTDIEAFKNFFGIHNDNFVKKRSMMPQINFELKEGVNELSAKLNLLKINNNQIKFELNKNLFSITFGHENLKLDNIKVLYNGKILNMLDIGLKNIEIQDHANTTAYHIPQGIFLSYPFFNINKHIESISTTNIAPTILENFNINKPEYMEKHINLFN